MQTEFEKEKLTTENIKSDLLRYLWTNLWITVGVVLYLSIILFIPVMYWGGFKLKLIFFVLVFTTLVLTLIPNIIRIVNTHKRKFVLTDRLGEYTERHGRKRGELVPVAIFHRFGRYPFLPRKYYMWSKNHRIVSDAKKCLYHMSSVGDDFWVVTFGKSRHHKIFMTYNKKIFEYVE